MPVQVMMSATPLVRAEANLSAGFPSPADDHGEDRIDLAEVLVPHPSATFTLRISGHSMTGAGIHDGDLAIVDKSRKAEHGNVIVAVLAGEMLCKRLIKRRGRTLLSPDSEDPEHRPIDVTGRTDFEIWAVVTATIRQHVR